MMTGLSVRTDRLSKVYAMGATELPVLKGISLFIDPGSLVALTGASGAGKSTLLHIVGTIDRPTTGKVFLGDWDMSERTEAERTRIRNRSIGFVFQFHHLLPEFTALENVLMPVAIGKEDEGAFEQRARRLLERMNMGNRLNHKPAELSGGEQQRVAIARALIHRPGLLLADEPTGNLDSHTSGEVFHLLKELNREEGMTLIMATHNEALAQFADRIIHMEDGLVVEKGPGSALS